MHRVLLLHNPAGRVCRVVRQSDMVRALLVHSKLTVFEGRGGLENALIRWHHRALCVLTRRGHWRIENLNY